jgi:glycosyltransferase involved in cell wall biosynthesis
MTTLADEFLERGIDTDIVLMRREGCLEDSVPSRASVFDLGVQNIIWGPPALAQYLRRRRPSVLLSAGYTNRIALLARTLIQSSTSIVISEHNVVSNSESNSSLPDWLLQQLTKWTYPLSDQMIAVSEGVADDVSQSLDLRRKDFEVVYNPVIDPETFERTEQTVEHAWFSDETTPVVLGVGRLVEQKGFSTLIRAFAEVKERRAARLVILGEGEKRPILERQTKRLGVESDIWMPGFVSNPLKYMARASVFVLSSRWEGLGNVLIEAMACGTPVVSTDCPSGPSEILKEGEYGRLVPVGDPSALAAAIEEALDGKVPPAPRSGLDRFRRDTVTDQYLDILSSVAQE